MTNQFEVFKEVVESGSYSNAAKKLYKSPSAISKQIASLEESLGAQLFDRTTRSLALTEAGRLYYEHCKEISQRINNAASELKSMSGEPVGDIKITWPTGLSFSKISTALGEFCRQYPKIKLDVVATNNVLNLKEKGIDIAFRSSPKDSAELVGIELFKVQPIVCASPEFVAQHGYLKSVPELAGVPNLLPSYINLAQKTRPSFPAISQLKLEEQHRSDDITSIINLVKAGVGAAFLFEHIVGDELESGKLVNLIPDLTIPDMSVYMIHHQLQHTPRRIRVFIDFFKAYFLYPSEKAGTSTTQAGNQ